MTKKIVKYRPTKNIKGSGFIEDTDKFLKNTKLLSKGGQAVLPFALGALGTTFSPLGTATGLAVAQAGVEGLNNYGYGKMSGGACYSQGQLPPNRAVPRGKLSGAGGNFQGTTYANRRNIGVFPVVPPFKGGSKSNARYYKTMGMSGGRSVYNDVVSQFGNPKF